MSEKNPECESLEAVRHEVCAMHRLSQALHEAVLRQTKAAPPAQVEGVIIHLRRLVRESMPPVQLRVSKGLNARRARPRYRRSSPSGSVGVRLDPTTLLGRPLGGAILHRASLVPRHASEEQGVPGGGPRLVLLLGSHALATRWARKGSTLASAFIVGVG